MCAGGEHSNYRTRSICVLRCLVSLSLLLAEAAAFAQAGNGGGQFSVSASGTPTYSYPITVPPGIAGMEPKLSLYYSGSTANGPLGVGWSIQGISTMSRCGSIRATDGKRTAVGYVAVDKLCIDGNRLIQVDSTGTPLALSSQINDASGLATGAYTEYRTERDQYARIRAYGSAGGNAANGPAYFLVWTKSGQIYEYGNTSDSQILAQGKTAVMVWAVDKISDTMGNYVAFKYTVNQSATWGTGTSSANPRPGTEWNLAEVWYTGTATQAPTNKIIFNYGTRTDNSEAYQAGSKNVSTRLLQTINTYVNAPAVLGSTGVGAKRLQLAYENTGWTGRTRLTQIADCSGLTTTKCLPPAQFSYHDRTGATSAPDVYKASSAYNQSGLQMMDPTSGTFGIMLGDFNGDGKMDILRWGNDPTKNQLLLSYGDGSFTPTSTNLKGVQLFSNDGCYMSIVADFNGDGLADIFRYESTTSVNNTACPTPPSGSSRNILLINTGNGNFSQIPITIPGVDRTRLQYTSACHKVAGDPNCNTTTSSWTAGSNFYFLDVNGDGLLDLLTVAIPAGSASDLTGATPNPMPSTPCPSTCTTLYLGSVPTTGGFQFSQTATNLSKVDIYTDPVSWSQSPWPVNFDLNYDGNADLVGVGSVLSNQSRTEDSTGRITGSQLGIWLSSGDGNFSYVGMMPASLWFSNVIDANGDGRFDGLIPGSGTGAQLMVSDGSQFQFSPNFNLNGAGNETVSAAYPSTIGIWIADVNGDGRGDIIRWEDNKASNAVFLSNGDGTFSKSTTTNLSTFQLQNSSNTNGFVVADFTGHGNAEILALNASGSSLLVKADPTPPDQLASVTSPNGAVTTLVMVPLSNSADSAGTARYQSDLGRSNASAYPTADISVPAWVVATETKDSGVGSLTVPTDYFYFGLKSDWQGRGPLGFRQVNRQGPGPDGTLLTVSTQYLQMQPYIGMPASAKTTRNSDGLVLSSTTNQYCDTTATNPTTYPCPPSSLVQRPYLQQSVQSGSNPDRSALPTVTTQNVIDGNGNTTNVTVTTTATVAGVAETYTKTVGNTYNQMVDTSGNNWILGRLTDTKVTNAVSPNPTGLVASSAGTAPQATATTGTSTPLTLTASPPSVSAATTAATGTVSAATTLTIGGYPTPALNYGFVRVSSSTNTQLISASGGPTVTFSASAASLVARTATETYQITVTDAVGRTGSIMVTASMSGGQPSAIIVPGWTNWGTVGAGSDSGDFSTVTNNGSMSVLLTAHAPVSGPAGMWSYSVSATGYCNFGTTVLAPGASCTTFFGTGGLATPGAYTATDQVTYQAQGVANNFTVRQGYSFSVATTTASPTSLSFGNTNVNTTSAAQTITLTNNSDDVFQTLSVTEGGSQPGNFPMSNNCGSQIGGHASCQISVSFNPTAAAAYSAAVTVTGQYMRYTVAGNNACCTATQTLPAIALSGTGVGRVPATVTIGSSTPNYTLLPSAVPGYAAGRTDVTLVINSAVFVYSTSTSAAALTISGFASGDTVTISGGGNVYGMGGAGGHGGWGDTNSQVTAGGNGGPAISIAFPITFAAGNGLVVAGGGGGGGGGGGDGYTLANGGQANAPGAGGGAGAGYNGNAGGYGGNNVSNSGYLGGSTGNPSASGASGGSVPVGSLPAGGGGGGPGVAGGNGGSNAGNTGTQAAGGAGGGGGGVGAPGGTGGTSFGGLAGAAGGAAGNAFLRNGNAVTGSPAHVYGPIQ